MWFYFTWIPKFALLLNSVEKENRITINVEKLAWTRIKRPEFPGALIGGPRYIGKKKIYEKSTVNSLRENIP